MMTTFTANDAKQNLGKVMDAALQGPVSITKHGRPAVVVTADREYRDYLEQKHEKLKAAVKLGFDQLERGEYSELSANEIAEQVSAR